MGLPLAYVEALESLLEAVEAVEVLLFLGSENLLLPLLPLNKRRDEKCFHNASSCDAEADLKAVEAAKRAIRNVFHARARVTRFVHTHI